MLGISLYLPLRYSWRRRRRPTERPTREGRSRSRTDDQQREKGTTEVQANLGSLDSKASGSALDPPFRSGSIWYPGGCRVEEIDGDRRGKLLAVVPNVATTK